MIDREPIQVNFNYYLPPVEGTGAPSTNDLELIQGTKDQDTRLLLLHDVRKTKTADDLTLDSAGFQYVKREWTKVQSSMTDEEIDNSGYRKELGEVVKNLCSPQGSGKITIYHLGHLIRGSPLRSFQSNGSDAPPMDPAWNKPNRGVAPAPRVHIDFTRLGVEKVLVEAFGEDSEAARAVASADNSRRILCFSMWRPLKTVKRDPLAVCDARSVTAAELVKLPRVYPGGVTGENVVVKASAAGGECNHNWYWMSNQTENEMLAIKVYDSGDGNDGWEKNGNAGKVGCAPHCSFHLPDTKDEDIRESIENRVVVVLEH